MRPSPEPLPPSAESRPPDSGHRSPRARRRSVARDVASILVASAVVFTARASLADHYVVPSGSMQPTVHVADRIFVNKLAYGLRVPLTDVYLVDAAGPSRGDVVVLSSPEDGKVLLKRVVALPGDRVRVEDGAIAIDGVAVPVVVDGGAVIESLGAARHELDLANGGGPDFGPVTVPTDHYLVLGDARGNSNDGRYFGFVARTKILGRAAAVILRDGKPTLLAL
jgi:signal peptidase I